MARPAENPLGTLLRSRRERLDPAALHLVAAVSRRTPGLRREEVAQRADISVEWYTRLEQGRGGTPSAQVLDRVADALLMSRVEREHLFLVAHGRPPKVRTDLGIEARPQFNRVVAGFPYSPAYVKTASWDVVAWNDAMRAVLTDYGSLAPEDRNVLRILFCDPVARSLLVDWELEARLAVSTFRLELARWGENAAAMTLIEVLRHRSPDFSRIWASHDVGTLSQGVKRIVHPVAGELAMSYSSYAIDDDPGLGLVLYSPETDSDASRIQDLLAAD